MYYNKIHNVLPGLNNDYIKIKQTINEMELDMNDDGKNFCESSMVKVKQNGNLLEYSLSQISGSINRIEGSIPLEKIYYAVQHDQNISSRILDLIEEDAIHRYFMT